MNGINSLINKSCILLDIKAQSIDQIIKSLTDKLNETLPDIAERQFMDKVVKDGFNTTCMGEGCVITHARCPLMKKSLIAVMRLNPSIDLGAFDNKDAKLVFLLVGPHKSASYHLKILSRLARILNRPEFREKLLKAPDAESFLEIIKQEEK